MTLILHIVQSGHKYNERSSKIKKEKTDQTSIDKQKTKLTIRVQNTEKTDNDTTAPQVEHTEDATGV